MVFTRLLQRLAVTTQRNVRNARAGVNRRGA
jgi:hypothetical protein